MAKTIIKNKKLTVKQELNKFLLYTAPNGDVKVEVLFNDETIWATQEKIAQLFGVQRPAITKHLQNIFKSGELREDEVSSILEQPTKHGAIKGKIQMQKIKFYNLDAIISVGYRVNSSKATQFRIWATERLKEYIIKGFSMDDDRLKNGRYFGKDYFEELLERVRSIRSSERRIYLKITDIFQECSIDYDPNSETTKDFFAQIQNIFHYAISGKTAAEIIHKKANKDKINMGLQTWKSAPKGRILKSDVLIAKNYLSEKEVKKLERIVSAFFDYIENVIENRNTFTMKQFAKSVEKFLEFNDYRVLEGKGAVSAVTAKKKAIEEYTEFNKNQKIENDFEKQVVRRIKNR